VRALAAPRELLVDACVVHLERVRGLAESTRTQHAPTAKGLLVFIGFEGDPAPLRRVGPRRIEAFVMEVGARLSRASLQHTVAQLRDLPPPSRFESPSTARCRWPEPWSGWSRPRRKPPFAGSSQTRADSRSRAERSSSSPASKARGSPPAHQPRRGRHAPPRVVRGFSSSAMDIVRQQQLV